MASLHLKSMVLPIRREQLIIYAGFLLAILMLGAIAVASFRSISAFVERVDNVERTQKVFLANQEVLTLLKDAIIAQRGFVITGEARYLAPREAALTQMHDKIGLLRTLIGPADADNQRRLGEIERLADSIFDIIARTIDLKSGNMPAEAPALVALIDDGKRDLDLARALVRDVRTHFNTTLLDQLHESQATGETTTRLLVFTELLSLSILILAFGLLTREVSLRTRAEQAVKRANDALEQRIVERTAELADANAQLEAEIGEHRRARSEVAELNQTLESRVAQRTAQLEDAREQMESFGYSVSHDLRAPLRAIIGFASVLEADHSHQLDAGGKETLKIISDSSRKMGQLIDDLLSFSRLSRAPLEVGYADMKAIVDETLASLGAAWPAVDGRCRVGPMPQARCDAALMRQVWSNLLANAIKFSKTSAEPLIEAGGYQIGRENVYFVRDNGVGFDMRYVHKLFGVFERLHVEEEFSGTGVGLAIVKRIVVRHGGRVWAEARLGEGASFYFALPRIERHAVA